jgi:hypothetical protein
LLSESSASGVIPSLNQFMNPVSMRLLTLSKRRHPVAGVSSYQSPEALSRFALDDPLRTYLHFFFVNNVKPSQKKKQTCHRFVFLFFITLIIQLTNNYTHLVSSRIV